MAFLFRLEKEGGAPAEPPTLTSAVPNWRSGDTIPLNTRTSSRLRAFAMTTETSHRCIEDIGSMSH